MHGFQLAFTLVSQVAAVLFSADAAATLAAFLGSVLLLSGFSKVDRPSTSATALMNFGVTRAPRERLARSLGLLECAIGVLLVVGVAPVVFRAAATALLGTFTWALARQVLRGARFACGCFGEDQVIGWATVLRTGGLGALALVAALSVDPVETARSILDASLGVALVGLIVTIRELGAVMRLTPRRHETQIIR